MFDAAHRAVRAAIGLSTIAVAVASAPTMQAQKPAPTAPNNELAAAWTAQKVSRLVFDTSVTPGWLETSDRFWYSYNTREGRRFMLVDPVAKTRKPQQQDDHEQNQQQEEQGEDAKNVRARRQRRLGLRLEQVHARPARLASRERPVGHQRARQSAADPRNLPLRDARRAEHPPGGDVGVRRLLEEQGQDQGGTLHGSDPVDRHPPVPSVRRDPRRPIVSQWLSPSSDKVYFTRLSRDMHKLDVCVADVKTGEVKALVEERLNTYIESRPLRLASSGQELVFWSGRDGWGPT
jgi:hypothetical protein